MSGREVEREEVMDSNVDDDYKDVNVYFGR
jgi:hypothetical protein